MFLKFTIALATLSASASLFAADPAAPAPNSVEIKNVPALNWGKNGETTFCGALVVAADLAGKEFTYPQLMAVTGLAFRTRWFHGTTPQKRWCPSSPVGEFPEECHLAANATGFSLKGAVHHDPQNPRPEECLPQVLAELSAGRPVLSYDKTLNVNILFGFDAPKNVLLSRDYFNGEKTVEIPADKLPEPLFLLQSPGTPLSEKEALIAGLKQGIANWDRDGKAEAIKKDPTATSWYTYGRRAYDQWISDLENADPAKDKELFQPSWWTFDCLNDARNAAAQYLAAVAPRMPEASRPHLLAAAEIYRQAAKDSAKTFMNKDEFLGPWTGKKYEDWTPEVRAREAATLKALRDTDDKAIAQLKLALPLLDQTP